MNHGLPRRAVLAAGALAVVAILLAAATLAAGLATGQVLPAFAADYRVFNVVVTVVFSAAGVAIVRRQPGNAIGWFFLAGAVGNAVAGAGNGYVLLGLHVSHRAPPGAEAALGVANAAWIPLPAAFAFSLAVFPDGRTLTPSWRPVLYAIGAGSVVWLLGTILSPLTPDSIPPPLTNIENPYATPFGPALGGAGLAITAAGTIAAVVSLYLRFRRARGVERLQLKWLVLATIPFLLSFADLFGVGPSIWISSLAVTTFVAPIALAILRYQLYGVVVNKTLVFGALAAFITGVYIAIVVGLGHLIGSAGRYDLGLSILATAIVAVAFQPVRERVQLLANRLVYGQRATPYEVLSGFSERVAGTYSGEQVLPRMARVLAEGTGASAATVWMTVDGELRPAASWPETARVAGEQALRRTPVNYRGEELGVLAVAKAPGDPLTPVEAKLLSDLSVQAGLVLHNVRLTEELKARLEEISAQAGELRESRRRIVTAQDRERRRLERDIHDGAQQHLVALAVKLRLVAMLAGRDQDRALRMLEELERETEQARRTLGDLARGIYPPLLRDRGLVAALEAEAGRMTVPVEVSADGLGRCGSEKEAAVYFSCLEALQNVAKHAHAAHVQVRLTQGGGEIRFSVTDDGVGFDVAAVAPGSGLRNMADRVAAVGGRLRAGARPGGGTSVTGWVPLPIAEPVA